MNNFFSINLKNNNVNNNTLSLKIQNLFLSLFFGFILIIITVIVIISPLDFFITKVLHFESIKGLIHQTRISYDKYPLYLIVFIGPFFEELLFRLALKVNKLNISIFLGLILYKLMGGQFATIDTNRFIYYLIASIILSILTFLFFPDKIITFLNKKINYLILISILLFGLVHILNIKIFYWELALFYPIYVLPQMIMGYFITNLRLKFGFLWGLLLHSLFNFISMIL